MSIRDDPTAVAEFRDTVGGLLPWLQPADGSRVERRLAAAQASLEGGAADKIIAVREFRDLMVQYPERAEPSEGLRKAREQLLAEAARLPLDQAEPLVMQAEAMLGEDAVVNRLRASLASRQQAAELIARADAAFAEGRLMQPPGNSAFSLLQQALGIQPDQPEALAGMDRIAGTLIGQARRALDEGDPVRATALLERARLASPQFPELARVDRQLRESMARAGDFAQRLGRAEGFLASGALIEPRGANALEIYRQVLADAPDETRAREGVRRVAEALVDQGRMALDDGDVATARALLDDARQVDAALPVVNELATDLQRREVAANGLVGRVEQLMDRGALTRPVGESAVDLMADLNELGQTSPRIDSLREQLKNRLIGVAGEAREFGMLDQARHYAGSARRIAPEDPAVEALLSSLVSG